MQLNYVGAGDWVITTGFHNKACGLLYPLGIITGYRMYVLWL